MAIPRPPTSSGLLQRERSGTSTYGTTGLGDYNDPITEYNPITRSWACEKDIKSPYVKGAVITLPGGTTFRQATKYSRENWIVGESQPASASGRYNRRYREAQDSGVDGAIFLAGNPVIFGSGIPSDAENEAVTKALNKLADSKANVGEALGTFGQTVRLFSGKVSAACALAEAIENKKFRKWAMKSYRDLVREGIPEAIARNYLEYIYGFKPIMSDIYGLHEFSKQQTTEDMLLSGHASASRTKTAPRSNSIPASYSEIYRRNHTATTRVKTHIYARLDPEWGGLRAWNQLGLANPAALAWELVPWSFVVDWLLPIGPVLNAMSASAGLAFIDASTSARSSESFEYEYWIQRSAANRGNLPNSRPAIFPVTYEGYGRKTYQSWPRPGLWVDRDPLRGARIFAATALAVTNLGGKKAAISRTGR